MINNDLLRFPQGNIGGNISRRHGKSSRNSEIYYYEESKWITSQKFSRLLKSRGITYKEWYDYHHLEIDEHGDYKYPKCMYCGDTCRWNNRNKCYDVYCENHVEKFLKDNLSKISHMKKNTAGLSVYKNKYGDEPGEVIYKEVRNKIGKSQTLNGYIEKYGEEEGRIKYNNRINNVRFAHKLEGKIDKYGEVEGERRHKDFINKMSMIRKSPDSCKEITGDESLYYSLLNSSINNLKSIKSYSNESKELFDEIVDRLSLVIDSSKIYYGDNEFAFSGLKKYGDIKNIRFADFYLKDLDIVIEFQGDYWHPRPEYIEDTFYEFDDRMEDSINNDYSKAKSLRNKGLYIFYVHESEYLSNRDLIIEECIKFITNKEFRDEYTSYLDLVL